MNKSGHSSYLLYGGLLAPVLYLIADLAGKYTISDYSFITNAVSEITQAGSSNVTTFRFIYLVSALATICLGIGIVQYFRKVKLILWGGIIIVILGFTSALTGTIFPMDPIGANPTFSGVMHLVLTSLSALLAIVLVLLMGIGLFKELNWEKFRYYSITTLIIMLIFGALSPIIISKNIPFMGLFERITVYTYMLWVFVLSYKLIRHPDINN